MLRSISRFLSPLLLGAMALMSGCGLVTEDVEPCTMTYQLKFKYDYNILEADAFNRQVHLVNVWAFDSQGRLAWTGSESGKALESPDYVMKAELAPGRYDFLAWCGFSTGDPFKLATYTPSSIEELKVTLATLGDGAGKLYVDSELPGLFHGLLEDVTLISSETEHVVQTVTLPLMKDTKTVRLMLQHLDGSPIEQRDFSVTITDNNQNLDWNNDVMDGHWFDYRPWYVNYGQVTMPEGSRTDASGRAITSVASLLFEMSTSRLRAGHNTVLTVHRNWDDRDIIRIPLIDYLLLVKGHYNERYSDQEYLDRMDEFNLVFFIDADSNWYTAAGIMINNWTIVPPQDTEM